MGKGFSSPAAAQVGAFVASRRAADALCEDYEVTLLRFDRHCASLSPEGGALTQGMVDAWFERRPTENANSCRRRCFPVASLVGFLRERGETDVVVPEMPRRQETGYVPHAFTDDELSALFSLCDRWQPKPGASMGEEHRLRNELVISVVYRLLWSSGIRACEARLLRRSNADLEAGAPGIVEGKGKSRRTVALHPSMLGLLRTYDGRMDALMPGRAYLFPNGRDTSLGAEWLQRHFAEQWSKVSGERATVYMLRHRYATTCINELVGRGLEGLRDLVWVSKAMGHSSVDVTIRSYYHAVPALAALLQERSWKSFDGMVPGVM